MNGNIMYSATGIRVIAIAVRINACLKPAEVLPELSFPVTRPVKKI